MENSHPMGLRHPIVCYTWLWSDAVGARHLRAKALRRRSTRTQENVLDHCRPSWRPTCWRVEFSSKSNRHTHKFQVLGRFLRPGRCVRCLSLNAICPMLWRAVQVCDNLLNEGDTPESWFLKMVVKKNKFLSPRRCVRWRGGGLGSSTIFENLMSPTPLRKWYLTTGHRAH